MKYVVITGASSGIGRELAKHYKVDGFSVINISKEETKCPDAIENIVCDVTNEKQVEEAFAKVKSITPKLDVLVNGALEFIPIERAKNQFDVNVFGAMKCCQMALPMMEKGSRIINICSILGMFPCPYRGYYVASKSALLNLTYTLYMECKKFGVDVVAILPSEVRTNFSNNRQNVLTTNDKYGNTINNAAETLKRDEHKRMSPEKAGNKIYGWCKKRRPKPMYMMSFKFKVVYCLERWIPKRLFLNIIAKFWGGNK